MVILDMIMPEMNGKEAFLEMRKINPNVNAVLLSGYSIDEEMKEALDLGLRDVIEKPFSRSVLSEKIAEVLNGS